MKYSILAVGAALVVIAGCGHKDETTYKTADGTVTVKQDGGSNVTVSGPDGKSTMTTTKDGNMTVTGPNGTSTMTSKDGNMTSTSTDSSGKTSTMTIGTKVDLSELGMKLYPGATQKDGGSIKTDTPDGVSLAVQLQTKDDAAKIIDFYKPQMKVDSTMTTPDGGLVSGTTPDGDKAIVVISKGSDGNEVSITVVKKKKKP